MHDHCGSGSGNGNTTDGIGAVGNNTTRRLSSLFGGASKSVLNNIPSQHQPQHIPSQHTHTTHPGTADTTGNDTKISVINHTEPTTTIDTTTTTTTVGARCVPFHSFSYVASPGNQDVDIEKDNENDKDKDKEKDNEKDKDKEKDKAINAHRSHATMMPLIPSVRCYPNPIPNPNNQSRSSSPSSSSSSSSYALY